MNIISNRCIGAYIYRDIIKTKFQNPFVWSRINKQYFNYLFEHYSIINFYNYELGKIDDELSMFYLNIDNKVRVEYRHIVFDADCKEQKNIKNTPWELVVSNYDKSLKRMKAEPLFFYMDIDKKLDIFHNYIITDIAKRIKKKIVILTTNDNYTQNEYVKIIKIKEQDWNKTDWWKYIKTNYFKNIFNALLWLNE